MAEELSLFNKRIKECLNYYDTEQMNYYRALYIRDFHCINNDLKEQIDRIVANKSHFISDGLLYDIGFTYYYPQNTTFSYKMSELYKLISNKSTRSVMEQAYYLEQNSRIKISESINIHKKPYLHFYTISESEREKIKEKCVEYDTAIGISISLYKKMRQIQRFMKKDIDRLFYNIETGKKISYVFRGDRIGENFALWYERNETFIDKLRSILHYEITEDTDLDELLDSQWKVICLARELYTIDEFNYENLFGVIGNMYKYQETTNKEIHRIIVEPVYFYSIFAKETFDDFAYWSFFAPMESVSESLYRYLYSFKEELSAAKENIYE